MLQKLQRETLAERAAASLLEFIQARDLKPGEALPSETRLTTEFGVSRPIIREALKSLQGKGVIEIVNGKGAIIRSIDGTALRGYFSRAVQVNRDTILELREVRRGLEVQSAILAATRRTDEELARMAGIIAAMRAHVHDADSYIDLDVTLHLLIASASHNAMMFHLVESIREASKDTIREGLRRRHTTEQLERVQALHEALFAEVRDGHAEGARRAMDVHFDEAVTALITGDIEANIELALPVLPMEREDSDGLWTEL